MIRTAFTYIAALAITLASCGERGKSPLPHNTTGEKLSIKAIKANINALNTANWTPGTYEDILNNQINSATEIGQNDRTVLTKNLREAYAGQMLRCAGSILTGECASSHSLLQAICDSLKALKPQLTGDYLAADIDSILSLYTEHNRMLEFSVATTYDKAVSYNSVYDSSYDRERRSTAASYRARNPHCETIKKRIDDANVNTRLSMRHADFRRKLDNARSRHYNNY